MCVSANEIRICKRKKTYRTIEEATIQAKLVNERFGENPTQRPYKCPVCKKFHLTCGSS